MLKQYFTRWATEDPNPTSKVAEKRRLEDQGQQAIANKLDPRMIDAMRAVRALEDEEEVPESFEDGDEPQAKRLRLDPPPEDDAPEDPSLAAPAGPKGLLSADTIEGMKYFAEIRKRQQTNNGGQKKPPATGLSALGGYGSDDDD